MFPIKRYRIKSHVSFTMQSWLGCWGTGCTVNYFMDTILDHSYLHTVSCFHHSWLNVRTDGLCVQRLRPSAGSSSVAPPVFLPLATELEKKWRSLPAAVVDSCYWSSRRDIYNSSNTKNSPNVSPNKEITAHLRSLLSQNNCFCIKWLKVHWRANQKNLVIDYEWLVVISYTPLHCVILLITNTKVIQM